MEFSWFRFKIQLAPHVSLLLEKKELSFLIKLYARYSHEEQIESLADSTVREIWLFFSTTLVFGFKTKTLKSILNLLGQMGSSD